MPAESHEYCFLTYQQIADDWGLTEARIRQLERRAIQKLRKAILHECKVLKISVEDWIGI